jgi:hypothetical protein
MAAAMRRREVQVNLTVGAVRRVVLAAVAALTVASFVAQIAWYALDHERLLGFVPLADSTSEESVPTYLSSIALLACAGLTGLVAASERGASSRWPRAWVGLTVILLLASLDEMAAVHERFGSMVSPVQDVGGILAFSWVIPGAVVVVLLALYYRKFFAGLPPGVRSPAIAGVCLLIGGALGVELAEAALFDAQGRITLEGALVAATQEALEMLGVVLLLDAFLRYVAGAGIALRWAVGDSKEAELLTLPSARRASLEAVAADPDRGRAGATERTPSLPRERLPLSRERP